MDISALKIPANKVSQFRKKGINTIEDLLLAYPFRYSDYRQTVPMAQLMNFVDQPVTVVGSVSNMQINNFKNYVSCHLVDGQGHSVFVIWFNQLFIQYKYGNGDRIVVHGKLSYNQTYNSFSIAGPTYFDLTNSGEGEIIPVYSAVSGMAPAYYKSCLSRALDIYEKWPNLLNDPVTLQAAHDLSILSQRDFIRIVHRPKTDADLVAIEKRKAVEMLLPLAKELRKKADALTAPIYTPTDPQKTDAVIQLIKANLPYDLTPDQANAIHILRQNLENDTRINALIQGDVGCGKTVIAIVISAIFAVNGYQAVIMAPTRILAEQHYDSFTETLKGTGIKIALFTESLKAREKKKIAGEINNGKYQIIIGTTSVLSDMLTYQNLGLFITDEEHRFGVRQREKLNQKVKTDVHNISMSATPIPRTLALALYGDQSTILDIHTMPNGRKPVQTFLYGNTQKTYDAMNRQVQQGHQCYVICPYIEKSDLDMAADVESVEDTYKDMVSYFSERYPYVTIKAVTGKTGKQEQQEILDSFSRGIVDILISTTLIEVGVNVPNTTVMVVKNAERFGLAQLHQLRGRVGRSSLQSYCVLLSRQKTNPRLLTMCKTTDGFEIAKADLKLRGAGDLLGEEQSGYNDALICMLHHQDLFYVIQKEIGKTL